MLATKANIALSNTIYRLIFYIKALTKSGIKVKARFEALTYDEITNMRQLMPSAGHLLSGVGVTLYRFYCAAQSMLGLPARSRVVWRGLFLAVARSYGRSTTIDIIWHKMLNGRLRWSGSAVAMPLLSLMLPRRSGIKAIISRVHISSETCWYQACGRRNELSARCRKSCF